jgi:4-hydroxybenzoate polyprenyltransferase
VALGLAAGLRAVSWPFWPLWAVAVLAMQREAMLLRGEPPRSRFGRHFGNQVRLGGLLLLALVLGRAA